MAMTRSENMRRIKSSDTRPEKAVRELLRQIGYPGYRLHRRDIAGRPDIAFVGKRKVIFVHGCFWHAHGCAKGFRTPKSNASYWTSKIERNRQRDRKALDQLNREGWSALVVWECELKDLPLLATRLRRFVDSERLGATA